MKTVIIQGATGSVGTSVLSVIRDHPAAFSVAGFAARQPSDDVVRLAAEFPGAAVALTGHVDALYRKRLEEAGSGPIFSGPDAVARMTAATPADMCVAAISGTAGLAGAFVAADHGMTILLANKEVLVSAGELFMNLAARSGATVLPLDSEHAALWQCLHGRDPALVDRVIITASGGPFWRWSASQMADATPADALKHPVWNMGSKISIDSATLANKALEVIEARVLYGFSNVDVLVHPQSVVHGMVEWRDGSVISHMGVCDMRQPINYMLFHPHSAEWARDRVDLAKTGRLEFFAPDFDRFPLLGLGLAAGQAGGLHTAYFNAANEEAVGMFLNRDIGFADIFRVVDKVMTQVPGDGVEDLEAVFEAHARAKSLAREWRGCSSCC